MPSLGENADVEVGSAGDLPAFYTLQRGARRNALLQLSVRVGFPHGSSFASSMHPNREPAPCPPPDGTLGNMPNTRAPMPPAYHRPAQPPTPGAMAHRSCRSSPWPKPVGLFLGLLASLELTGCTPPSTRVAIEVWNPADGQPAAAVPFWATSHDTRHPLSLRDILRRAPRQPPTSTTDRDGRAVLTLPADRPFSVVFWVPDHGPEPALFPEPRNLPEWCVPREPTPDPGLAFLPATTGECTLAHLLSVRTRRMPAERRAPHPYAPLRQLPPDSGHR
jgi:hypothetical protein